MLYLSHIYLYLKKARLMSEEEIFIEFEQMLDHLRYRHGIDLDVDLVVDWVGSYPEPRDFAKTTGTTIFISPKLSRGGHSVERVRGLLYHEIGHVLLMQQGDYDHSEEYADYIAELCFQTPISYDTEDVQTTGNGTRPRPRHLPR